MSQLLHHFIFDSAANRPESIALTYKTTDLTYQSLADQVKAFAMACRSESIIDGQRVAVYLAKEPANVIALFGALSAGNVMVPINPQLKSIQVKHIVADCQPRVLVTTAQRLDSINADSKELASLRHIILTDSTVKPEKLAKLNSAYSEQQLHLWRDWLNEANEQFTSTDATLQDSDLAALLYTSGSTGQPKGVMLSHKNMVEGAKSVAQYLNNEHRDVLLAALPLSFDYGLSQLTTAFLTSARVVLIDFLFAKDIINAVAKYQITGLAAVPPLWVQLAQLEWPENLALRYITNSGGVMPLTTLQTLRSKLPNTLPYLMYGLTEAFRSTYLPPEQIDVRPQSMGRAIPNAKIFVINDQKQLCKPGEIGELVHAGVHVGLGYWQRSEQTAERFKPLPPDIGNEDNGLAVWSGDYVKHDEAGYLYFVGRRDEMIKSSGYRISPAEIEAVVYQLDMIDEVAAVGVQDDRLGQAVVLCLSLKTTDLDELEDSEQPFPKNIEGAILKHCASCLPNFMQPKHIMRYQQLPKNSNGKIDRALLKRNLSSLTIE
ncbi:MAG: acyl-CoA ligase (AMP-forming), exosortase A system-associated [Kangiellaceae bacterium]|jgi:acyl-CoA ligase (AMP-forming) (exosortase A-associated)|nr:acyl-CoA ligase (AMP-forming), exosortase A system-associated [Kangiellaceae bacterium]